MKPVLPPNGFRRLEALRGPGVNGCFREGEFDDIAALAAGICDNPISFVILTDGSDECVKGMFGSSSAGLLLNDSFRACTISSLDSVEIPDAFLDARFKDNSLVYGEPGIRFYAGIPLVTEEGKTLGTLCVMDLVPGRLNTRQWDALATLGRQVDSLVQLRIARKDLAAARTGIAGMLAAKDAGHQQLVENITVAQTVGNIGSWSTDGISGGLTWSEQTHRIFETCPGGLEPTYQMFQDFVHPEDREGVHQAFVASFSHRNPCSVQHRIVTGKGRVKYLEASWQTFLQEDGKSPRAIGIYQDITDRKQAEDERDRLFNLSLDMLCVANFKGTLEQVNPAWTHILGWTADHLTSRPMSEFIHPDDQEATASTRANIIQGNSVRGFENRYRSKDGSYRWLSWNVHPLTEVGKVFSVARDITERKLAEETLLLSEAAQRQSAETQLAIQDALPAHIALIDPSGVILAVNESWRRFSSSSSTPTKDFFVGFNYLQACETATGEEAGEATLVAAGMRDILAGRTTKFEMEYFCELPEGRQWYRLMVTPLREGVKAGAVVMHIDITDRKLAEARLSRRNRLYQVMSRVNEAIVRVTDLQELMEKACNIAVQDELFRTAAIFRWDTEIDQLSYLASAGTMGSQYEELPMSIPSPETGTGTVGTALRTGHYDICNDVANDPRMAPWWDFALARGYRSTASFPIMLEGRIFGVLVLSAPETGYFQEDEIDLLVSVADNLSFAIESLNKEQRRLQAEIALRDNEASMAAAQRVGGFGSWELELANEDDMNANRLRWSDEMFRVAGLEPNSVEVTNELFFDLVHPDDHQVIKDAVAKAIAEQGQYSLIHRLIRPDGEVRILHETAQLFVDENGKPLKMVGNAHDITEQRRAETTLRDSEQRFRQLAENIHEVFWITAPEGRRLIYVSPAFEKIWGHSCHSLYQSPRIWLDAILPEDRERVLRAEASQSRGEYDVIYRIRRSDGQIRWIHDRAYPVFNEQGQVYRIVGTAEDVTERELAEEKLREQATLLDNARDAILVLDLDHRIVYWNRGAERLYGWTGEEALGKSEQDLYHTASASIRSAMQAVLSTGEWMGEIEQSTRDGKSVVVEGRWTLLRDETGRPKSILAINTDISGRKKLERHFLRAQRMESIGTLAGGIAHDLNNVLAPIMMSIDLLKMYPQEPQALEILNMIASSARRGADMVGQVLSFARGMEGRRGKVDVGTLVGDLLKIAGETFPKNISFEKTLEPSLWMLEADQTQLHQVLLNLCVNSRDAMPSGGRIRLGAANRHVDAGYASMNPGAREGPHVRIEVEDTGMGMPREIIDNCFDPFFTTKEVGKGTGLGLSTALAIVKGHGGFIQVQSEPGKGTRFRLYLPANEELVADEAVTPVVDLSHGNGEVILVVDDETSVRQITRQMLESVGYTVLMACDGAEAVRLFEANRERIRVVLTDMMMPIMDGPALVQILRGMEPGIRIIGTSGIGASGLNARSGHVEVDRFLTKPYTAETLLGVMKEVLGRRV